jgi:hypothetical protein
MSTFAERLALRVQHEFWRLRRLEAVPEMFLSIDKEVQGYASEMSHVVVSTPEQEEKAIQGVFQYIRAKQQEAEQRQRVFLSSFVAGESHEGTGCHIWTFSRQHDAAPVAAF